MHIDVLNSDYMIPFFVCYYATHFQFSTDAQRLRVVHLLGCALRRPSRGPGSPERAFDASAAARLPVRTLILRSQGIEQHVPEAKDLRAMLKDLERQIRVY